MDKINLSKKISEIRNTRRPNVIAVANGKAVKAGRIFGMPDWKRNDEEDEVFVSFVHSQKIQLKTGSIELNAGEMVVIPRGVDYRPIPYGAAELVSI